MLESLRLDLAPEGIGVSVVLPGFVRTPLTGRNDFHMPFLWGAERAARYIADSLERNDAEIRFPWQLALPLSLVRLLPEPWIARLLGRMVRASQPGSAA
jgi:short-subunit dehydrogenase